MSKRKNIFIVVILIILLTAMFAFAEERKPEDMDKFLNLSKEQQQLMKKQFTVQREKMQKNMEHVRILHQQLDEEFLKDQSNEQKIKEIIAEIKKTQSLMINFHFDGLLEIRHILTKEQFKKMVQSRQKMNKEMANKMGKKKGGFFRRGDGFPPPPMIP